jgi:hypothetical protein
MAPQVVCSSTFDSGVLAREVVFHLRYALAKDSSMAVYTTAYSSLPSSQPDTLMIIWIFLATI